MQKTTAQQVGANVRAELGRRNVSQAALAAKLGMSQSMLSYRLAGKPAFDVNELARVAEALDIDVAVLMSTTASSAQAS